MEKNVYWVMDIVKSHLEKMKSKHGNLVDLSLPTSKDKKSDPQIITNV